MAEHNQPILNYASPTPNERRVTPNHALVTWRHGFTWLVVSFIIWRSVDWWAYVQDPIKPWPKFELPLWYQLSASLLLGVAATALIFKCASWIARRFRGGNVARRP